MGIVYITTNLINNKKYIGVDTNNNKYYYGSGVKIKLAIKKYGAINFKKDILEESDDKDYLFEREKYWISLYDAVNSNNFYNIASGGRVNITIINDNIDEDTKNRIKNGINKAKIINLEKRKGKTYEEIYGVDRANIEKQKRKDGLIGKKHTKERNDKSSKSHKGLKPWNKGLTKETDDRVLKNTENSKMSKKKFIYQYILNNELIFNGRKELENYIKNINSNLNMKCRINVVKLINNGFDKNFIVQTKKASF